MDDVQRFKVDEEKRFVGEKECVCLGEGDSSRYYIVSV